jgi:ribulose-bisphosphate carboxylase small chain
VPLLNPAGAMAESYLPFAGESDRRSAGLVQHLVTMFVGFGLGCAMIYAAGGQPLAVILPAENMAAQPTQPAQAQFLQPLARMQPQIAVDATTQRLSLKGTPEANLERLAQIQAYSPFNGKKYETLSYLPPLTNEDIAKQITFMIKNHWTPCLEVSDDGDIYLNTAMGPNYYDNRYWSLYKLPMFGCTDPNEVIREIEACKREFPNAKVRVIAFDSKRQVQTAGFIVRK